MVADLTETAVWQALESVMDPEIPVISLVELGVIKGVAVDDTAVTVTMTPTFTGCPALREMERLIEEKVQEMGGTAVVNTVLSPAWSSDDISETGRQKLKQFGLAPPPKHGGSINVTFFDDPITCPHCDSTNTILSTTFGTTLCRAMFVCNNCKEPFEQFKPL